jgi:biopolymer transport protein ExbD
MFKYDVPENFKIRPTIQLAPLVDIAFWALIFFMAIAALNQMESEMDITVPQSKSATQPAQSSGKIIVNVTADGRFVVNQKQLTSDELDAMLKKVTQLFPNQAVIIRADQNTYHKYVVQVLDACMRSNITDISFSTSSEEVNP